MFLGISIIGWFLLGLIYSPATFLMYVWVSLRWRQQRWQILVVGTALYIALAAMVIEAMVVNRRFEALCEEVQLKVVRKVVVDGFYEDSEREGAYHSETLTPFDFIESRDKQGRFWRTERAEAATLTPAPRVGDPSRHIWLNDQGKEAALRKVQIDKPSARYHWRRQALSTSTTHLLARSDEFVIDSQTGEVIGSKGYGYRRPPFADALWLRFFDSPPAMCPDQAALRSEVFIGVHDKRGK